jgi:hypothetical protein
MYFLIYPGIILILAFAHYGRYETSSDRLAVIEAHRRLAQRGETFGWPFPPDYCQVEIK